MTDELPRQVPTDPLYCNECLKDIDLERDDYGLVLVCGCGTERRAEVKQTLPEGWE